QRSPWSAEQAAAPRTRTGWSNQEGTGLLHLDASPFGRQTPGGLQRHRPGQLPADAPRAPGTVDAALFRAANLSFVRARPDFERRVPATDGTGEDGGVSSERAPGTRLGHAAAEEVPQNDRLCAQSGGAACPHQQPCRARESPVALLREGA